MKMIWTLGSAMLTLAVATVGAQSQSATTTASDKDSITVTGCLQSAGGGAVGTSGSASTSSTAGANRAGRASGPFMLVNARVGAAPGGGSKVTSVAPAGSGTTDSAVRAGSTRPSSAIAGTVDKNGEPTEAAKTFSLSGDFPELPQHVGQEVEISGNMIASTGASGAGAASASSTTSGSGAGATQQIEVKSIRMIASVCAAK